MGWDFIADSILMTMKRDLSTFVIRWDFNRILVKMDRRPLVVNVAKWGKTWENTIFDR